MPRFEVAGLSPAAHAARDEQTRKDAEGAAALVAALAELRHHLLVAQPAYVHSAVYVFGGTTTAQGGAYAFASPFDTPAQYRVVAVAFTGAGIAFLSQQPGHTAPGITTVLDPTAMTEGQAFAVPGALTVCGSDVWSDIPGNGQLFLAVAATSATAYVSIQFRRRVSPAGVYAEGHS